MSQIQLTESVLKNEVDKYVEIKLKNVSKNIIRGPKVIHDSVHGTNMFQPHEIALLDLPIIQKLRRISQTDVASFVFPAGNHNRFEHTVGVTVVAGQMVDTIFSKSINDILLNIKKENIYNNCRAAAILHDCGHGPFSHLSEQVYGNQFTEIKKNNKIFAGASPHEILSYFIATSTPMKEYNEDVIKGKYGIDINLDFVGEMIVGYIDKSRRPSLGFAVEIINGAFDADKLDYILRDAHSTGICMALDLPRLMYTLDVLPDKEKVNRLAIDISGVSALEEIVFNKMMLTSTIYHHQKVRAAGCVVKSVLQGCSLFEKATDYLNYTDDQVFNIDNPNIKIYLKMLQNRDLPKRAFCFSPRTLEEVHMQREIMVYLEDDKIKQDIIENISTYIKNKNGKNVPSSIIWIDSPKNPSFKEATQCIIKSEGASNNYILLRDVFPTDDWVRAFSENKWQGFVYTMPEYCSLVAEASQDIFEQIFQTKFNTFAKRLCKIV